MFKGLIYRLSNWKLISLVSLVFIRMSINKIEGS